MEGDIAGDRAGDACLKEDSPGQEYRSGTFLKDCSTGQPTPGHVDQLQPMDDTFWSRRKLVRSEECHIHTTYTCGRSPPGCLLLHQRGRVGLVSQAVKTREGETRKERGELLD